MKPFFWPLACGAPSPHQSNALKGVGSGFLPRELVTFSEFFACNLHASCIQLTEFQRWNSENKISCMRLMLSGFHYWSPVSFMQVACNAMQNLRVSLYYTFSEYSIFRYLFITTIMFKQTKIQTGCREVLNFCNQTGMCTFIIRD